MARKLSKEDIAREFMAGRNCAQCVLGAYAEDYGFEPEETDRLFAAFGGGMEMGDACGAVTGALAVIGLAGEDPAEVRTLSAEFRRRFAEQNGSCQCRQLLGLDFAIPEQAEQIKASGKLLDFCPGLVESSLHILEELLAEADR